MNTGFLSGESVRSIAARVLRGFDLVHELAPDTSSASATNTPQTPWGARVAM
jgi:hypothetical protein